jgi:hypothetical protein
MLIGMIAPSDIACASRWPYAAQSTSSGTMITPPPTPSRTGEKAAAQADDEELRIEDTRHSPGTLASEPVTTRPELRGSFGHGSRRRTGSRRRAGMAVLEQGGNAFDAAVAAGLTLQVVEPHLNGPGGDMPALVWPAGRDRPAVLCAQGPAPAAATIERYRDELGSR